MIQHTNPTRHTMDTTWTGYMYNRVNRNNTGSVINVTQQRNDFTFSKYANGIVVTQGFTTSLYRKDVLDPMIDQIATNMLVIEN